MDEKPHIKEFSKNSSTYSDYNFIQKKVAIKLLDKINFYPNTIIDLGCGSGLIYKNLKFKPKKFIGIDLSSSMLALHPKSNEIILKCKNFDELKDFSTYDLVISSSSLQWSNDIYNLIQNIEKSSKKFALAIFCDGTFKSLRDFFSLKSFLPNKNKLKNFFTNSVSYETIYYKINFDDNLSILKYIKKSGVSGGRKELSIKNIKTFLQNNKKKYLEFEILLITKNL